MRLVTGIFILLSSIYAEECTLIQEQNFGAIGDTSGKSLYTKTEYTYECNTIKSIQGECIEWKEDSNRHIALPEDKPVAFKDEDFTGGLGQMAQIFAGYSQLDHIWSGWKGLCYDGVLEDFSWLSDPLMWANMLAQAMGADANSKVDDSIYGDFKDYAGYAQCTIQMGAGIGGALESYNADEIPCDPIDEFCDEEEGEGDENVMSVTKESYEKLISQDEEYAKYIEILSEEDGILIIKITQPKDDTSTLSASAAADAMKKIREIMLAIRTAFIAYDAYNCFSSASGGVSDTLSGGSADGGSPIESAVLGGVNRLISSTGCIPCSIGFTLVVNLINSFNDVDTCSKKDDAKEQGERHLATYSHKKEGMCHFIRKETEDGVFTKLDKYYYCCYDDVFSRILAEQFKAQYAKNWNSCSDVSLKEIANLNFSPCKKEVGIDPNKLSWDAEYEERTKVWQYQEKCVDFTELTEYLSDKFNANIDQDSLYDQLEDLKDNIPE